MEPFELAEQRERLWDVTLARLPRCSRCDERIMDCRFFCYGELTLCGACLRECMTEAEEFLL